MKLKIVCFSIVMAAAFCFLQTAQAEAEELSYDRYAALYEKPLRPDSWARRASTHFLVYPFELIRWPMDKSLLYVEKHYLDKKVEWIYNQMQNRGLTPNFHLDASLGNMGAGATLDIIRAMRLKDNFPDAAALAWVDFRGNDIFEVGSKAGLERIAGTGFHSFGWFEYEKRREEKFYGVGPDSSLGDSAVYSMETTLLKGSFGYSPDPLFSADTYFSYRNINISGGRAGGSAQPDGIPTFSVESTPGIRGDNLITLGAEVVHDTRNQKENSTSGGLRRLGFSFNEGVDDSRARYLKYELEASQYWRLGSNRRVLAGHVYAETNDEIQNGYVPFHQMARLGGYGLNRNLSHTLRGYRANRFHDDSAVLFNLEYRYTIWEYRDWKLDTIFSWDQGQVFGDFSNLKLTDFRESYGLGFRWSLANIVLLSIEMSHGDEGTQLYVRSHAPF